MGRSALLDRTGTPVPEEKITELDTATRGRLIRPDDPDYESARRIWNALVDKHPGAILKCSGTADVAEAVRFARDNNVVLAVRGGGHNVGGRALCDDGLVADLSGMRGIHVDPDARKVRAQGGATLGDVDRETHLHGLAVPLGVISKTGIAGLTLGGGVGWLVRRYGPTCDNLIEAEVVTADGKVVTANADTNADLFWALRGGGGNFGVVTSFLYRAFPVSTVLGGLIVYPRDAAGQVLRGYRDLMSKAPDELTAYAGLLWTPDGVPVTAVIPCWSGDPQKGEAVVAPFRTLAEPMMVAVQEMPFPAMQSMLDDAYPEGSRNYWKSSYLTSLPDEAIDVLVEQGKSMIGPTSALLIECHGGTGRSADTAFAQRDSEFLVAFMPMWTDPAQDNQHIGWARAAWDAVQPWSAGGTLLNYIGAGEDDAIRDAFGGNYRRLTEVKAKFDPTNLFDQNQNIQPAAPAPA